MDKLKGMEDKKAQMANLAYEQYMIVEKQINAIIDTKWMGEDSKLILLGGIMVNMDG